ncbi:TPA: Flp pilus assembly complex ATPase component TadA [Candidatus Galligastranaerophilus intestinigallinarum]|nr:Flp pilus assembly complex ATPase component TadA [Candidatus Galligastranaerophilus intestinigallinarum]
MDLVTNKTIDKLKYDLVRNNIITFEDIEHAQEIANAQNTNLGQVLINSSLITEAELLKFLEEKLHIPYVNLDDYEIDKKCLQYISYKEAITYKMLPLFQIEDTLTVIMADPLDLFAIDKIIERTGKTIEPVLGSQNSILKKINEYYDLKGKVQDIVTEKEADFRWIDELHSEDLSEEHLQNLFRGILKQAIKENIHELYFEHLTDSLTVYFKKQDEAYSTGAIPSLLISPFIQMLKSLCALDPTISEIPQLGKLTFNVDNISLTASISAYPTISGERILLKIYHPPKKLEELIKNEDTISKLKNALLTPGVVLVCGSSLSGKTHLVYSILDELTPKNKTAMTLESIAKYKLKNVIQSELNESVGFNLDKAMRYIEFQSPDIVYFEGIETKEGLDFFTSLTLKNKTLITEFLADNMDELRRKFSYPEFSMFKSVITCLLFIHNKEEIEFFDKTALSKYLF